MQNGFGKTIKNDEIGQGFLDDFVSVFKDANEFLKDTKILSSVGSLIPDKKFQIGSQIASELGYGQEKGYQPKNEIEMYLMQQGIIKNDLSLDKLQMVGEKFEEQVRLFPIEMDPKNDMFPQTNNTHKNNPIGILKGRKINYSFTFQQQWLSMDQQFQITFPQTNLSGVGRYMLERWDKDMIFDSIKVTCNSNKNILINTKQENMQYAALFTHVFEKTNPNYEHNGVNTVYDNRNDFDENTQLNNRTIDMTKIFNLSDIFGKNSFFSKSFYVSNITFDYELTLNSTFLNIFKNKNFKTKKRLPVNRIVCAGQTNLRNSANNANVPLQENVAVTNNFGILCARPDLYAAIVNKNAPTENEFNALQIFEQAVEDAQTGVWIENFVERLPVSRIICAAGDTNVRNAANDQNVALLENTAVTNNFGILCARPDLYAAIADKNNPTVNEFNALEIFEQAVQDAQTGDWLVENLSENVQNLLPENEDFEIQNYDIADDQYLCPIQITQFGYSVPEILVKDLDESIVFDDYFQIYGVEPHKVEYGNKTNNLDSSWIKMRAKFSRQEFENQLLSIFIGNLKKDSPIESSWGSLKKYEQTNFKKFLPRNNLIHCKKIHVKMGLDYFVRLEDEQQVLEYFLKEEKETNIAENLSLSCIHITEDELVKYSYLDDIELECEFELDDSVCILEYPLLPWNSDVNYKYNKFRLLQEDFIFYCMSHTYIVSFAKGMKFCDNKIKGYPSI